LSYGGPKPYCSQGNSEYHLTCNTKCAVRHIVLRLYVERETAQPRR